ncbi:MAG: hypothetical protein KJ732_05530 [Candidatus Margulisbacteria bacterium]|nr:hypothetical protein [Candidatus Margulisiibacteriota bacterium]
MISPEYVHAIFISLTISSLVLAVAIAFRFYLLKNTSPWLFISGGLLFYAVLRVTVLIEYMMVNPSVTMNKATFEIVGFVFTFVMLLGIFYLTESKAAKK